MRARPARLLQTCALVLWLAGARIASRASLSCTAAVHHSFVGLPSWSVQIERAGRGVQGGRESQGAARRPAQSRREFLQAVQAHRTLTGC